MNLGAFGTLTTPQAAAGFIPGGRLTLVTGSPVISSDQASKTVVYYTPTVHAWFPVIRNGVIRPVYFGDADLKLTLTSAHAASSIVDVFGVEIGGKGRLLTGPAWSNSGAGVGDRGTGGGTSEHTFAHLRVNKWPVPGLNGEGSAFIPPLEGTYLGSLYFDGSNGQITDHVSYGQSRKRGVWNAFNQKLIYLKAGDPNNSWNYTSTTNRASNNDSANKLTLFSGLAEENFDIRAHQRFDANAGAILIHGIGFNSTTTYSGSPGYFVGTTDGSYLTTEAHYLAAPSIGINTVTHLESGDSGGTFFGTETSNVVSALWRG